MSQAPATKEPIATVRPTQDMLADSIDGARVHAATVRSIGDLAILPADDTIPPLNIPSLEPGEYATPNEQAQNLWVQEAISEFLYHLPRSSRGITEQGRLSNHVYTSSSLEQLKQLESTVWWVDTRTLPGNSSGHNARTPYFLLGEKIITATSNGSDAKVELLLGNPDEALESRFIVATVSQVAKDAVEQASFARLQAPTTEAELAARFPRNKKEADTYELSADTLRCIRTAKFRGAKLLRVPNKPNAQTEFYAELTEKVTEDGLRSDDLRNLYTVFDSGLVRDGMKSEKALTISMLYDYDVPHHLAALSGLQGHYEKDGFNSLSYALERLMEKLGDEKQYKLRAGRYGFVWDSPNETTVHGQ